MLISLIRHSSLRLGKREAVNKLNSFLFVPVTKHSCHSLSRSRSQRRLATLPPVWSVSSFPTSTMALSSASKTLSDFLQTQKSQYLEAVEEGKGGDWVIVTGNEAGGKVIHHRNIYSIIH